jgi:SgrR family transcriptional regulator
MQLIAHYIRLFRHYPGCRVGEPIPTTLDEIARILCCTPRNGKFILQKWVEQHWIHWLPGRGRGHRSAITFIVSPADLLLGKAKELVFHGQLRGARELIREYAGVFPDIAEHFHLWIKSHFGYHTDAVEGRRIDVLRLPAARPLLSLDPAFLLMRLENHIVKHICDTLVRYEKETETIRPHLAYGWEIAGDHTVWTFYLRKGVLFHHGRPLTAHDVKDSLDRIRSAHTGSPSRWMLAGVKRIDALDEGTVRFTLERPNHLFLHMLCSERLSILPARFFAERPAARTGGELIGTGPFKLVYNDPSMFVLEAFEPYFRERAILDRIECWIVPEWEHGAFDVHDEGIGSHPGSGPPDWTSTRQVDSSVTYLSLNAAKQGPLCAIRNCGRRLPSFSIDTG